MQIFSSVFRSKLIFKKGAGMLLDILVIQISRHQACTVTCSAYY